MSSISKMIKVCSAAFSRDGLCVATGTAAGQVSVYRGGESWRTMRGQHGDAVRHVAWSPDGSLVASSGGWDKTINLWNVTTQRRVQIIGNSEDGHTIRVVGIAWSPDGQSLVSGGLGKLGGSLKIWSLDGTLLRKLDVASVYSVVFSPNSKIIACGGFTDIVCLWMLDYDIPTISQLGDGIHNGSTMTCVKFSPDSNYIASKTDVGVAGVGVVKIWSIESKELIFTTTHGTKITSSLIFSRDSKYIVYGCSRTIYVCDFGNGKCRTITMPNMNPCIALNIGENTLVSCNGIREVTCISTHDTPIQSRERIYALFCALKCNKSNPHREVYQLGQHGGGPLAHILELVAWWEIGFM